MKGDLFDLAFDKLCELEGFNSNVKGDPGGRTIWGISERWSPEDVRKMLDMGKEEAKEYAKKFYYERFWRLYDDTKVTMAAFLMGVNAPAPAIRAVKEGRTWEGLLIGYLEYYSTIVGKNPKLLKFLRGWCNRVVKVWEFVNSLEVA
jgi:hypothetical protein